MSRHEAIELEVKKEVAAGTHHVVERFRDKHVQVHGTFTATLQMQGKIGAHDDWTDIDAAFTASGFLEVPHAITQLRVNTTAYTNGDPKVTFGGFDVRSA